MLSLSLLEFVLGPPGTVGQARWSPGSRWFLWSVVYWEVFNNLLPRKGKKKPDLEHLSIPVV